MSKTIFMIHGMWGGGWYWEKYKKYFEEKGYSCITPTLRFHNIDPKSTPPPQLGRTSLVDYRNDLEEEINRLTEKPIIMGHSMGGLLAQMLAGRALASKLILLSPASPYGILALTPSVIKSFSSILSKWGFWKKANRQTFNEAVYSMLHLLPAEQQKEIYDKFVYESGRAAGEIGFWIFDLKKASRVDASKVNCPVLIVAGSEDRITPVSVIRKVAAKYKDVSTFKIFPNHAHWVVSEPGWEEIAGYVFNWLNNFSD